MRASSLCELQAAQEGGESKEEIQDITDGRWPFQSVADQLLLDCLNPAWETRHGAALALREILSWQAGSAAVTARVTDEPAGKKEAAFSEESRLDASSLNSLG